MSGTIEVPLVIRNHTCASRRMEFTMKQILGLITILAIATTVLVGCKSEDPMPTEAGAKMDKPMSKAGEGEATLATTAKCEGCGSEFKKSEMKEHDGKMYCEACAKAHGY